jgi:menaquinol-cytochrome c reductase iron-sulfur subunit
LSLDIARQDGWKKSRVKHAIWARRQGRGEGEVTVLSPLCPHLGCPLNWHPDQKRFQCPCHAGAFDANGQLVSGPPPRAMDALDFEVRAGRLWVRWQDFKIGVGDRVPVTT